MYMYMYTVEPPIKDSPRGGHNRILWEEDTIEITSLQRTHFKVSNVNFSMLLIDFEPVKSRKPLTRDNMAGPNVSFVERFLYYVWYTIYLKEYFEKWQSWCSLNSHCAFNSYWEKRWLTEILYKYTCVHVYYNSHKLEGLYMYCSFRKHTYTVKPLNNELVGTSEIVHNTEVFFIWMYLIERFHCTCTYQNVTEHLWAQQKKD